MMGKQVPQEAKLFYYDICLERRIPQKHLLRKIKDILDFDFVYPLVKDRYGKNGNVSIPPPVIMKMMLLLFLYEAGFDTLYDGLYKETFKDIGSPTRPGFA